MTRIVTISLLVSLVLFPGCSPAPQDEPAPADTQQEAKEAWTVGIYSGTTPFDLAPAEGVTNPVLTGEDVTDFNADIAAHPFLVREDDQYCLFFTAKYGPDDMGGIGLALSPDGLNWTYEKMVIKEPFVLSYPYVFKWQDEYYMIPEAHTENAVRLYRATDFPREWAFEKE